MQQFSLVYNNLLVFLEPVDEPRPTYDCGQLMEGSSTVSLHHFFSDEVHGVISEKNTLIVEFMRPSNQGHRHEQSHFATSRPLQCTDCHN